MIITQENAEQYEGKYLDVKNGFFHYYPLKVVKRKTGYHVGAWRYEHVVRRCARVFLFAT